MTNALVILCGGDSSRMGTDKALLPFGEECLLEYLVHRFSPYFDKIYFSVNKRGDYGHLDLNITEIPDIYLNAGPMGAILSSLTMILEDRAFFISIDTPFLQPVLGLRMLEASQGYDASCIRLRGHYVDAIAAVYSKACIPAIGRTIMLGSATNSQINSKCYTNDISLEEAAQWSAVSLEDQLYRLTDRDSYYLALFSHLTQDNAPTPASSPQRRSSP
jgi:molybdopterin-guanine dinucleotide biosynthesis protein A